MKFNKVVLILLLIFCTTSFGYAQTDTLIFNTGELIVGEIKGLDKNVITIETAYSDSDFKIDWSTVREIYSDQYYLITLNTGQRLNGYINSENGEGLINIDTDDDIFEIHFYDIVYFNPLSQSFWDKLSASVDVGLQVTKANNLRQFNTRTTLGYLTRHWELSADYNTVISKQDSIADTRRMDANVTFKVLLPRDWYVFVSNDFLQNDEQKLKLRSNTQLGVGYYMIHSNSLYWSLYAGAALNYETYTDNTDPDRESGETFYGTQLNLFNTGDLSLNTSATAYPNFTESGRTRVDFKFDIKYDLPLDFYVKLGTTVNYDSKPVEGASDLDYVIQTGIGWEW